MARGVDSDSAGRYNGGRIEIGKDGFMNICQLGAGTMGRGIAQELAEVGFKVVVADDAFRTSPAFLQFAKDQIMLGIFLRKNAEGKFVYRTRGAVWEIFNRIEFCATASDEFKAQLMNCDAVIEAIDENIDKKAALYSEVEKYLDPDAPIFTNTSTIDGRLAKLLKNPERFAWLHFFNPVPLMKPVEYVSYEATFGKVDAFAKALADKMGKRLLRAPNLPGAIVNRILMRLVMAFGKEIAAGEDFKKIDKAFTAIFNPDNPTSHWTAYAPARRVVEAELEAACDLVLKDKAHKMLGMAEKEFEAHVDELMRLGTNAPYGPFEIMELAKKGEAEKVKFPMGPARLLDHVGLDIGLDCCKMLKLQEPDRWEIPEVLEKMVAQGKKGKKSGEGFYDNYKKKVTFAIAPDKSYARIGWTGKTLPLELIKKLKENFELAKELGAECVILDIKNARGADINEFLLALLSEEAAKYAINTWHPAIKTAMDFPEPVIVSIKGSAYGGAYEWALTGDHIIAEKTAKIGLVELKRGILPGGGGTQNLTRLVGRRKATEMILRGATIDELGEEVGPPWVDEAVEKITEERLMELVANRKNIKKRNRDPLKFSLWDKIQELRGVKKLRKYWGGLEPESFELARNAIWYGNQKPVSCGMAGNEFDAIVAAFETNGAWDKIMEFFEESAKKNKEGKEDL